MPTMPASRPTERNRLLRALPRSTYRTLLPDLEAVTLPHGAVLFEARAAITHIYFPQRCVISLLTAAGEGPGVEVGLIGNEGMAGLSVFLGAGSSTAQAVLQVPDGAWRMEVGAFRRAVAQQPSLRDVLQRYTQSVISQVTQGLACNQRHAVAPRCARRLLMAHDRVGADRFSLTQEFLGQNAGRSTLDGLDHGARVTGAGAHPLHPRYGHGPRSRRTRERRLYVLRGHRSGLCSRVQLTPISRPPSQDVLP